MSAALQILAEDLEDAGAAVSDLADSSTRIRPGRLTRVHVKTLAGSVLLPLETAPMPFCFRPT